MSLSGLERPWELVAHGGLSAKTVFNDAGANVFSANLQHRDQKGTGSSYKNNCVGNALAAMLAPGRIGIWYPKAFLDSRVTRIMHALPAEPERARMACALALPAKMFVGRRERRYAYMKI